MATFDEIKKGIADAISNPDTMETALQKILETIEGDYAIATNNANELEKASNRIRDLQDTNHKLFLSQVSTPETVIEEHEKPRGIDVFKEFMELTETPMQETK